MTYCATTSYTKICQNRPAVVLEAGATIARVLCEPREQLAIDGHRAKVTG